MKEYILSIISVILLTGVAGIILPDGKMGKFVKSVFALITLVIILNPLVSLMRQFTSGNYEPTFGNDAEIKEDVEFIDYIEFTRARLMSEKAEEALKEKGYEGTVEVIYESIDYNFKIKKIKVNLKNKVIDGVDKHINIEEVKQAVADALAVKKELIVVNEISAKT